MTTSCLNHAYKLLELPTSCPALPTICMRCLQAAWTAYKLLEMDLQAVWAAYKLPDLLTSCLSPTVCLSCLQLTEHPTICMRCLQAAWTATSCLRWTYKLSELPTICLSCIHYTLFDFPYKLSEPYSMLELPTSCLSILRAAWAAFNLPELLTLKADWAAFKLPTNCLRCLQAVGAA